MRVLTVGQMYPPHHLGGYELLWQGAVRHLRASGHDVRVLTTDYRRRPRSGEDPDIHRELRWYWRDHAYPRLPLRERLELECHNAAIFDRSVEQLAPDVVTWWAMGGMSLSLIERARRAGLPAVGFVIDDWLVYGADVDGWLRASRRAGPLRPLIGRLTGIPTRLDPGAAAEWVFASEAVRKAALTRWTLPRTSLAYCGIDASFLDGADDRDWSWRLVYVGRIDPRKGIDVAIAALAHLPGQARLRIVGEGDEGHRRELERLAERLGVGERVEFAGSMPRSALPAAYSNGDVLVFPVRWDEPWGLVPLEAMARRRPVLATGSGGSGEYMRDGENCLLFERDDSEGLGAAVRRLAEDEGLRSRLVHGGLASARRYTEDAFHADVEAALARARTRGAEQPVGAAPTSA